MTTQNPFALSSPAVGATGLSITPILSWTEYPGAKWYEVTVSVDPTFAIPEWSRNVYSLVYGVTPRQSLKYGTNYYWKVRGVTAGPFVQGTKVITQAGPWQVGAFTTKPKSLRPQPVQIFVSHTKKDVEFCNFFDAACARVGIKAFRSELEDEIKLPAWQTIREEIRNSCALFLIVGKELVQAQTIHDSSWEHTQNWIAFEIGVACEIGLDVWVICDDTLINFPVPYLSNYLPVSLRHQQSFRYFVDFLRFYASGREPTFPSGEFAIQCPNAVCKAFYSLNTKLISYTEIVCPQCLQPMLLPKN